MRIGFIAGIHEDIIRLKEAWQLLQNAECEKVACLGDIVGFSELYYGYSDTRDANESIAFVRENCGHVVVGNHDLHIAQKTPQNTVFSYPVEWNHLSLQERQALANGEIWLYEDESSTELTTVNRIYIDNLNEYESIQTDYESILISHYVFPNLIGDQIVFDAEEHGIDQHMQFAKSHDCTISIFSHDLCDGLRVFTDGRVDVLSFGVHLVPDGEFAFNIPWVANGTSPNGVAVLDLSRRTLESIPLNTIPYHV